MKTYFTLLIGCLIFFSCSDDDPYGEKAIQNAFNAVIGKWEFSRIASDPEFKNILELERPEYQKGSYIEFYSDSTYKDFVAYDNEILVGTFEIQKRYDNNMPYLCLKVEEVSNEAIHLIPDCSHSYGEIYKYTDQILVFYLPYDHWYVYAELKRIN